ncbi:MAG TPA: hypothetical protein VLD19_02550, partial [Chitinophagaceae bacterium]|nr:hypothetical protein [Chitinophagaceae bacterium]
VLKGQNETYYYSKTNYETSPLSRVISTYAAGNSWAGSESAVNATDRHGMQQQYFMNTAVDVVQLWTVSDNAVAGQFGNYSTVSTYPAGELFKTIIIDEHGKQVIEFKDKGGKIILKKVQLAGNATDDGSGSNHTGWLCSYYVYDKFNLLRAMIQPRGVELLPAAGWQLSTDLLNEQCFRYEYDQRHRLSVKKVPGAGEVYMVYDTRDRLVFTQDANLRGQGKWLSMLYDELNRPVVTGLMSYNATLNDLQQLVANQTTSPVSIPSGLLADRTLPESTHSGTYSGDYQALSTITMTDGFETTPGAAFSATIVNDLGEPVVLIDGQQVNINPLPAGVPFTVLTTTYYDDYSGITADGGAAYSSKDNSWDSYFSSSSSWPYPQTPLQSTATKGLVTGTKTRVLNVPGDQYLYTASFYDDKGRVVQTKGSNISGGLDINTTQYSFSGQPLVSVQKQQQAGANVQTNLALSQLTYDDLGRLIKTEKKVSNSLINGGNLPAVWTTTAENQYDALGQLKTKSLGKQKDINGNYTGTPIETLTHDYNIRGWLLG